MKLHGKLKASITVETALVLPIVLFAMFAVLFITFVFLQDTITEAVLNMTALRWTNVFYANQGPRSKDGYLTGDITAESGLNEYNIKGFPGTYGVMPANIAIWKFTDDVSNTLSKVHILSTNKFDYTMDCYPRVEADIYNYADPYAPSGPFVALVDGWLTNNSSPFRLLGNNTIYISGTSPVIKPGQYIRETDSKCAVLTASITVWNDPLNQFISSYLADLFTKGTIS